MHNEPLWNCRRVASRLIAGAVAMGMASNRTRPFFASTRLIFTDFAVSSACIDDGTGSQAAATLLDGGLPAELCASKVLLKSSQSKMRSSSPR